MKKIVLWTLAAAMLLLAPRVCPAQKKDLKRFVTIAFAGYDELMKSVATVGKLAGMPGLPETLEGRLQNMGMADALKALDKKRPWIATVRTDAEGSEFPFQVFVPTSDVKKLLKALPPQFGQPADAGDGVLELALPGRSIFIKQHDAWAVFSDKKDMAAEAPADPIRLAGGMQQKYLLGVDFSMKSVPKALRTKFLDLMSFAMQAGVQKMPGESDEQFAVRSKMLQQGMEQLRTTVNDLDSIKVGVNLDEATLSAYLEVAETMVPGSATAKKLAKSTGGKTQFAGVLLPGAAVTMHVTQRLDRADVEQFKANLAVVRNNAMAELEKQNLPEEQAKLAKKLAGDLMDVADKTLDAGKIDGAASIKLAPKVFTLVAGVQIAEGAKLQSVLKQVADQVAKDDPEAAKLIKLNAEEHGGIRFDVVSIPLSMTNEEVREKIEDLVGERLDIVIGVGDKQLYLAAGRDAVKTLTQAIDASKGGEKALPPFELSIAAEPIARFVADDDGKQAAAMIANILQGVPGKDHVKLIATPIPNGVQVRLEAEEGILKSFSVIPAIAAGRAMPAVRGR